MKKLLTVVLALTMALAIALPALAETEETTTSTVGWDEILSEVSETVYDDFDLEVIRLNYSESTSVTSNGFLGSYYTAYDPENQGVVVGSPVRFYVKFTLPSKTDLKDNNVAAYNEYVANGSCVDFTIDAKNFTFTEIEGGYRLSRSGSSYKSISDLMDYVDGKEFELDSSYLALDSSYSKTFEFMLTGTTDSTSDVTATATLSFGYTGFDSDGYFYFTVGSIEYSVLHAENYFYIENLDDSYDYVVRFTVNSSRKITDIAVSDGSNHTTASYTDVNIVETYDYDDYVADPTDIDDDIADIIADYESERMIENLPNFMEYYLDEIADDFTITSSMDSDFDDILDDIEDGVYNSKSTPFKALKKDIDSVVSGRYAAYSTTAITVDAIKADLDDDDLWVDEYSWALVVYPSDYNYESDGDYDKVTEWDDKIALGYTFSSNAEYSDEFYSASKIVDSSAVVFSLSVTQDYETGYIAAVTGATVEDGAEIDATYPAPTVTGLTSYTEGDNDYNTTSDEDVMTSGTTYKKYLSALNEILDVLSFEWDGSTKYMQEEHFVSMFSNAYAAIESVTWSAYEATLIVEPEVDPPQTGDASTIVGFVMLGLALAVAAIITVRKVRA